MQIRVGVGRREEDGKWFFLFINLRCKIPALFPEFVDFPLDCRGIIRFVHEAIVAVSLQLFEFDSVGRFVLDEFKVALGCGEALVADEFGESRNRGSRHQVVGDEGVS